MNRTCAICKATNAKYKCPICLVYYCSVACCNKHRMDKCDLVTKIDSPQAKHATTTRDSTLYRTEDTVESSKLNLLAKNTELKNILSNSHLQALLSSVNDAENAETAMASAMQEPIFVEFANACLDILENNK